MFDSLLENSRSISISCARDGVAVEEMQGENPGGRNGSAGIVDRIAGMKVRFSRAVVGINMSFIFCDCSELLNPSQSDDSLPKLGCC